MRRFIFHILLFVLPVILVLILIPVNKRQRYISLKDDCFNHGIWLHDRIFENTRPVDIAFIGSSHTINAVDDQQLETLLNVQQVNVLNLGYCRLGRNMDYVILKELLEKKKPKQVILEVRETESRYGHPIFPHVAAQKDVLLPALFFNRDILKDAFTAIAYKIELIQDCFFSQQQAPVMDLNPYGFSGHTDTAKKQLLDDFFARRQQHSKKESTFEHAFYNAYPKSYLEKIIALCKKNQVTLSFLYLPGYGSAYTQPEETAYYVKHGKLLLPPAIIFQTRSNWFDENHLNKNGSKALSQWLGKQL